MSELKYEECGTELEEEAKECPSGESPIEEAATESAAPIKARVTKKFNVTAIISLLLGVVIIIMGITVMNKKVSVDTHAMGYYDADYAAFGADFYTEIYRASDIIVDELNKINDGVVVLSQSMKTMANVIYYPVGMMIVALGLGVVAVSCNHIKKETA